MIIMNKADIKVRNFLDELDTDNKTVTLEEFKELMVALEEAGWRKQKPKKVANYFSCLHNQVLLIYRLLDYR